MCLAVLYNLLHNPVLLHSLLWSWCTWCVLAPSLITLCGLPVQVYEPGGHFKVHRDTEKEAGMFATLVG